MSGEKLSKRAYVKLAKGGTKSGYGYVDSFIEGIGVIERKTTDLTKVTTQTAKNHVNDAAKYVGAISQE